MSLEKRILDFFYKIEIGEITINPLIEPAKIYCGHLNYRASNGWEFTIFNDANTWDYVDNIKINENIKIEFEKLDDMLILRNYIPSTEVITKIYGIPAKLDGSVQK